MLRIWGIIWCICLGGLIGNFSAQNKKPAKIDIKHADNLKIDNLKKINKFIGNVHMTHENMLMWCDSLYQYPDSNYIEAFGHVRARQNDSIHLAGDYMHYDGNTKMVKIRNNVSLRDPKITLTTNFLDYDGLFEIGYYFNGGQIKDSVTVLTSKLGNYFTKTKLAYFKDSVRVDAPDYIIHSDTLKYQTETKVVSILGPTNIYGKGEEGTTLYSEDGWYNTLTGHAELYKNNHITYLTYGGTAKTMVIDSITQEALLIDDVVLTDTVNDVIVKGNYGMVNQKSNNAFVTDRALLILAGKQDSLFLHGDTLFLNKDTLGNNILKAYYKVRFYSKDLQGVGDSVVYLTVDSMISIYKRPVIWASGNQMTGEIISILTGKGTVKEFYLKNQAMMIARREETEMFDQLKGRNMTGYFKDNELYRVFVDGNGESIYYPDDKGAIIGMNRATSSNIRIEIKNRKVTDIIFINKPEGELNPLFLVDPEEARLKGFQWLKYLQPKDKHDIFNNPLPETKEPVKQEEKEDY